MKLEPRPVSLHTLIAPPINWTRPNEMLSPRPVPPKRRVVLASACVKGVNNRDWLC